MQFEPGNIYHIYNRGNNQQIIYFNHDNYLYFKKKLKKHIAPQCEILAWCLMPNHFHLLIYIREDTRATALSGQTGIPILARKIGTVLSSYTQAINKQENRTGSLFQQKTKAKKLSGNPNHNYSFICFHYIHQNPLRARLVKRLEEWKYSSFNEFYYLRNNSLVNKDLAYKLLEVPNESNKFYDQSYSVIHEDVFQKIF